MALDGYKNLALGQVATAPSPPTTGLSLALQPGQGSYFPAPPFNCTVWPASAVPTPLNAEIIRVTAMSGDTFTTIARTQETALGGPATARTITVGDYVALTFSAKWVADLTNADNLDSRLARRDQVNTFSVYQAITSGFPQLLLTDSNAPVDARLFRIVNTSSNFSVGALNDAATIVQSVPLTLTRGGDCVAGRDVYEKGRTTPMGHWLDVPFSAGNFFSDSGMTWTVSSGNVSFNRYTLIGKTLIWLVYITGSTLSGTASAQIYVRFPTGFTGAAQRGVAPTTQLYDSTTSRGWARVYSDGQSLVIQKDPVGNFVLNSGSTYVEFTIALEIT